MIAIRSGAAQAPEVDTCGVANVAYKGLTDGSANNSLSAPPAASFNDKQGDTAGWISVDVQDAQGYKAGQEVNTRVAFLPMAVEDAGPPPITSGSDKKLWTIGFLSFSITSPKNNEHHGKPIGNGIVKGPVASGGIPDEDGVTVVKLTSEPTSSTNPAIPPPPFRVKSRNLSPLRGYRSERTTVTRGLPLRSGRFLDFARNDGWGTRSISRQ